MRCNFCKRRLTNPMSLAQGAGPECSDKLRRFNAAILGGTAAVKAGVMDLKLIGLSRVVTRLENFVIARTGKYIDPKLLNDLFDARRAFARRAEYLAGEGIITLPEINVAGYEEAAEVFRQTDINFQQNPTPEALSVRQMAQQQLSEASFMEVTSANLFA